MRKRYLLGALGALLLGIAINKWYQDKNAKTSLNSQVVNVFTWMDYIPPHIKDQFEKETGIKVNLDYIDSDESLESKVLMGNSGYDVICPSSPHTFRHVQLGAYEKLPLDKIPSYKNVDKVFLKDYLKNGELYAVPYLWGTSGFAYDKNKMDKLFPGQSIDSWAYLYNKDLLQKLKQVGIGASSSSAEFFASLGFYLGYTRENYSVQFLDKALNAALELRPNIRVFLSSDAAIQALGNGEVAVSAIWNGDAVAAQRMGKDKGIDIKYVVPKEGALKWVDAWAVPKSAPHKEAAYRFIEFMLRPDIMAEVTKQVQFANTSSLSNPFIPSHILNNISLYPSETILKRTHLDIRSDPELERLTNRYFFKLLVGYK